MIIIKKLFIIIAFLLPITIFSFKSKSSFIKKTTFFKSNTIIVHLINKDLYLDLNDYLIGVVSSEMPALFNDEALKAQAVASRSYVLSGISDDLINISSSTNDQVYQTNYELHDKWQDNYDTYYHKISSLVNETKNEVIKRDNKIVKTFYFSMSNGYTENSINVFSDNSLTSVKSEYENESLPNFISTKAISSQELQNLFNLNAIEIGALERDNTNHVIYLTINGNKYKGTQIRKILGLRSTDFTITKSENNYLFTTKGYGHDVGMSQYGANEMAKHGYNYKDILMHYYQNTKLTKI
jgi:stage II sporulation protein D